MYNENLNQEWIDRLKRRVEGKSLTFVGNSASMFSSKKFGKYINESEFVLRFGKGVVVDNFKAYTGTKTDAWFFGASRAGMYEKFADAEYKIFTPSQLNAYRPDRDIVIVRPMADGTLQPYRDFFMSGSINDLLLLNEKINGVGAAGDNGARISQGADCLNFFSTKVDTYKEINLVGFDFFKGKFKFQVPKYEGTNTIHPGTSWHCPLTSEGYKRNPHDFAAGESTNEEKYIRSLPRVIVHEMPEVDEKKMEIVLKILRGSKASVIKDEEPQHD